jgi:ABC-type nitrate/sulfonate/bicarbonate transport system permease component
METTASSCGGKGMRSGLHSGERGQTGRGSKVIGTRLRTDLNRRSDRLLAWAGVATVVIAWEALARILLLVTPYASSILPTFESIFGRSFPGLSIFYGMGGLGVGKYGAEPSYTLTLVVIAYHSLRTFIRIIGGFLIGSVLGIGLGLVVKASREASSFVSWQLQLIRIIPQMALIPLFIIWFGGTELGFMLFIGFGVFTALFVNTVSAVDNVNPICQKFALTLGATKAQLYRDVILPAIIPELLGGLKVIVGQAWALSMAAEFLASQNGLGRIIILARQRLDTGQIIIVLLLYMAYTILFLRLVYWIGGYATRWKPVMDR